MVGVHTPGHAFERDANNVRTAIGDDGIEYPTGQDNDFATWTAYRIQHWPAKQLIGATGTVRSITVGEGNYVAFERQIRHLLEAANPGADLGTPVSG